MNTLICQGSSNAVVDTAIPSSLDVPVDTIDGSEGISATTAPEVDQETPQKQHYEVYIPQQG